MASTPKPAGLPPGMTEQAVLLPVDYYAQLCVTAQRMGIDPADLLGMLVVARFRDAAQGVA